MALEDRKLWGEAHRDLPGNSYSEAQATPGRMTKRGELFTQSIAKGRVALCDEGSYFVATNPTPGTGIAGIAATGAFSDAESLLHIRNGNTGDNAKRIVLDYIKLQVTAAGTNGTDKLYTSKLDTGVTRYTSGGSVITPVNPNMASSESTNAVMEFGALITTAASANARLVGNGVLRPVICVVGDEYLFDFGGDMKGGASSLFEGTLVSRQVIPHVPVILGPADQLVLSLYGTAESGASSYEFEVGYWER